MLIAVVSLFWSYPLQYHTASFPVRGNKRSGRVYCALESVFFHLPAIFAFPWWEASIGRLVRFRGCIPINPCIIKQSLALTAFRARESYTYPNRVTAHFGWSNLCLISCASVFTIKIANINRALMVSSVRERIVILKQDRRLLSNLKIQRLRVRLRFVSYHL